MHKTPLLFCFKMTKIAKSIDKRSKKWYNLYSKICYEVGCTKSRKIPQLHGKDPFVFLAMAL